MKYFVKLFCILLLVVCVSACEHQSGSVPNEENSKPKQEETKKDTIKTSSASDSDKGQIVDSIPKTEKKQKADSAEIAKKDSANSSNPPNSTEGEKTNTTAKPNSAAPKTDNEVSSDTNDSVENETSPFNVWNLLSFVSLVAAIVAICFVHINKKSVDKKISGLEEKINKNFKDIDSRIQQNDLSSKLQSIEKRLAELDGKMNTQATEQKDAESQNATKKQEQAPTLHEQYARAVSGSYLTGLCNNKEGCIFVITYKDFNDAEFDIYSFQNFQQSDGVNTVVDIIGSGCSIKNAKQHRVIAKGKCQKNQDLWEVTKNLKIEIS